MEFVIYQLQTLLIETKISKSSKSKSFDFDQSISQLINQSINQLLGRFTSFRETLGMNECEMDLPFLNTRWWKSACI